jgi:DNA-binding response OmpR family regulator
MSKIKILIVEDETIVALDIKSALTKLGFFVLSTVTNYDDAMECVTNNEVDVILMDINLDNSKKDGIDTAKDILKLRNIPIIYLTAYSDDDTIRRAIQTNPIGYLTKPFKRDELKSTILLGLYKINQSNKSDMNIACKNLGYDYYYDLEEDNLYFKKMPIQLGIKERILLKLLIDADGAIVSFENLEYEIWPDGPVSESSLRTLLYRLRSKFEYKLIETIPSFGCKLIKVQ